MNPSLIPALGGTVGLLAVAGWLVISFMRENSALRTAWREEIRDLKAQVLDRDAEIERLQQELALADLTIDRYDRGLM